MPVIGVHLHHRLYVMPFLVSKYAKIAFLFRSLPRTPLHWEAYSTPPDSLAGFKRAASLWGRGRRQEGRGQYERLGREEISRKGMNWKGAPLVSNSGIWGWKLLHLATCRLAYKLLLMTLWKTLCCSLVFNFSL